MVSERIFIIVDNKDIPNSLNPYCSGIWSRRDTDYGWKTIFYMVLILIVVEYGLGEVASNDIPNLDKNGS